MKLEISTTCGLNDFDRLDLDKKIQEISPILEKISKVGMYLTDTPLGYSVIMKADMLRGKKIKIIKLKSQARDKTKAINKAINKLSKKYFKLQTKWKSKTKRTKLKLAV